MTFSEISVKDADPRPAKKLSGSGSVENLGPGGIFLMAGESAENMTRVSQPATVYGGKWKVEWRLSHPPEPLVMRAVLMYPAFNTCVDSRCPTPSLGELRERLVRKGLSAEEAAIVTTPPGEGNSSGTATLGPGGNGDLESPDPKTSTSETVIPLTPTPRTESPETVTPETSAPEIEVPET
ncbi:MULTISPECIES: hypothetical protein [Streptosporangium]|uniref:Uncharacterized protein n=1 Tax=Streptosporangium brasiliense TaxID=47480 RepID=A0ABT9RGH6_9ACTN|nr:hypothetical protein [Streptosporangium brasiliense]MDP9868208.1 hypothetical protein [Streptosporangium brasiliense]